MTIGGGTQQSKAKSLSRGVKALLLDLDDTLYRQEEVPKRVRQAIENYMVDYLNVPREDVAALTQKLYLSHGTTMAGLVATGHPIDFDKWHAEVHHVLPYDELLQPDPALREMLCSIDLPKYILTNADKQHADLVLARLGLADCFRKVYHFEWVMEAAESKGLLDQEHPVMCKPNPKVYELVLEDFGCQPSEVIFFDDSVRNIAAAHAIGIPTVLVGREDSQPGADVCIKDMHALPRVLPELIDSPGVVHEARCGSADMLVSVAAV